MDELFALWEDEAVGITMPSGRGGSWRICHAEKVAAAPAWARDYLMDEE